MAGDRGRCPLLESNMPNIDGVKLDNAPCLPATQKYARL